MMTNTSFPSSSLERVKALDVAVRQLGLTQTDSLTLVLELLVWAKLSAGASLPPHARLGQERTIRRPLDAMLDALEPQHRDLFGQLQKLAQLESVGTDSVLQMAERLVGEDITTPPVEAVSLPDGPSATVAPPEVVDLMLGLASPTSADRLYAPWDFYAQFAIGAARSETQTIIETPVHSDIPRLLQLLTEGPFTVRYVDPIRDFERNCARQDLFDLALAFPPLGFRYDEGVHTGDGTPFPEQTTSGAILAVRQLLARTRTLAIAAVPNNVLFSTGAERALRQDLLQQGMVRAVIAMPAGLLNSTSAAFSILVLDARGGHKSVTFVDAKSGRFHQSVSKARTRLTQVAELIKIAMTRQTESQHPSEVACISVGQVLDNDITLQPNRYVLAQSKILLARKLSSEKKRALSELAVTIRPLPLAATREVVAGDQAISALEVGVLDLPTHGYIQAARRQINVSTQHENALSRQCLRPLDLIVIIKGSVGKVGIVPATAEVLAEKYWVVGQSGIVLRIVAPQIIDPRALFMQLRSPIGQELLSGIVSGATTPLIQLRELMALPVIIPSPDEQYRAIEALNREDDIQRQIDALRKEQERVANDLWQLT